MKKSAILLAVVVFPFSLTSGEIVVNEIYGGGGKSSAPFNQDFVELFNNGTGAVDISGFKLGYAKPGRSFRTIATIPVSTILEAGEFYVIGGASGPIGAILPHADFTALANLNPTVGKVKLLDSSSFLVDRVDYNMTAIHDDDQRHRRAAHSEIAAIFSPRNAMSDQRVPNGIDTNNNNLDFQAQIPTPDAMNASVPEPSTWIMVAVGAGLLAGARRFRRKQT
jgi:hypothetical protein